MKTYTKKIITLIALGALTLGALSGGLSAFLNNGHTTEVDAGEYWQPSETYTNGDGDTYYNEISDSLSGDNLLSALRELNGNRREKTMGYKTGGTTATDTDFIYTDYDTSDPSTLRTDKNGQVYGTVISSFYSYRGCTKFNKEHVWPKTHGGNKVEADIHMARPTIEAENGNRGHSYYVENMNSSNNEGFDPYYAYHLAYTSKTGDLGEQTYYSRGESARIIFYCMVASNQLVLEAGHTNSAKTGNNRMGDLVDLLKWNLEVDITEREKNRNEGAEYLQGNRNPFIDHPEYACKIWGNTNDATKAVCKSTPTPTKTLSSITVSGSGKTNYVVGETFNKTGFIVTANYSDSTSATVTSSASFENKTFTTEGAQTVTVSYTEGTTTKTTTVSVNVTASAVPVTSVSLDKSTLTLDEGDSDSLVATVLPLNATNKNVTWSSSDEEVAEVVNGVVTGISQGTATITVSTVDGNKTASCNVTVNHTEDIVHVTSVSLNKKSLTLNVDEEFTLEATVLPENATIKGVKWASTNEEVAIVEDGKVTALKAGACTISATSLDKKKIAVCTITVNEDVPDPTPDPDPTPSSNEQIIKILKVSAIVLGVTTVVVIFGIVIPVSVHKKHKRKMK